MNSAQKKKKPQGRRERKRGTATKKKTMPGKGREVRRGERSTTTQKGRCSRQGLKKRKKATGDKAPRGEKKRARGSTPEKKIRGVVNGRLNLEKKGGRSWRPGPRKKKGRSSIRKSRGEKEFDPKEKTLEGSVREKSVYAGFVAMRLLLNKREEKGGGRGAPRGFKRKGFSSEKLRGFRNAGVADGMEEVKKGG